MKQELFLSALPIPHRINVTSWGETKPHAVVCVHGLTRNGRDFDALAEALAARGHYVLCPTMAGRGLSENFADAAHYTYPTYIGDILTLLHDKGVTSVDWVGTSMGGLIGMMIAAMPNSPIRRMVINDVGPFIPLPALQRIATYVGMATDFADKAQLERHVRQIYKPFGITRDEDWAHIVEHSYRNLPNRHLTLAHDIAIGKAFAALTQDVDLWPVYDALKQPTLLLRGAASDVLSAEVAEEMTRRGPRARLMTYAGIGHAPALMEAGQIQDIVGFIEESQKDA